MIMSEILSSLRLGYSRMVLESQIQRIRALHENRRRRLAAIRTRRQAEAYRDEVSVKIAGCFGSFPERTPLNAQVGGHIDAGTFQIEKLLFESRPGCFVSASLCVPKGLKAPAPAVLGNCGHDPLGKAGAENQAFTQELAQCGFVVLTFDPIAQGERDQYLSLPEGHLLRKSCVEAHNMIGQQLQLAGKFVGSWMAWDAMRALDYLASRPEVDSSRLGVTGNSGGGVLSTWLWALDRRLFMAAPSCFVTTFLRNIESELCSDAEQMPPGILEAGLELGDAFLARVPEPAIIISQKHDFFDRRGVRETAAEVSRIYGLFKASDRFSSFVGDHTHGYFPDGRMAMRRFFCRHAGRPARRTLSVRVYPPEKLFAAPEGQVLKIADARPVRHFIEEEAVWLRERRGEPGPAELLRRVRKVLGLEKYRPLGPVHHRNLRGEWLERGKLLVGRYAVETESGIEAILRKVFVTLPEGLIQALQVERGATLYIPHWSCQADLQWHPMTRKLLDSVLPLYGVDARGIGESLACIEPEQPDYHRWMDYMVQGYEGMMGRSFLGCRVLDVLRTCDLLAQEGARGLTLVGRGQGALIAAFAAVLHPRVRSAELHGVPASFEDWVRTESPAWYYANCPRDVLRHFDLRDLHRAFPRKLIVRSCWDAETCPAPPGISGKPR